MTENDFIKILQIIVLISVTISAFYIFRIMFFYFVKIKTWKTTEGKILESDLIWFRSKTDSDTEGWKENVRYKYSVESIDYENTCLTKNIRILSSSKKLSQRYFLKIGETISITYNPKNPKESILDNKFNFLTLLIPLLFYTVLIYFVFSVNAA
jgi:hypothetical protein